MILVKQTVKLTGQPVGPQTGAPFLHPRILWALWVIDGIYTRAGEILWLTSAWDGVHKPNSLHYAGQAVDLRTKVFPSAAARDVIVGRVRAVLASDGFDVILEDPGGDNEHLHVEYDPGHTNG